MARETAGGRVVGMVAAAGIVIAGVGLVTGTSSRRYSPVLPAVVERPDPGPVPPARSHAELETAPWRKRGEPAGLGNGATDASTGTEPVARETRRAFDGAPPTIPHPVGAGGAAECLACHGQDFALGARL